MKTEYFFVDIDKIEKHDFISNEKMDVNKLFLSSNLPEEYRKFIFCHNKRLDAKFSSAVQLGDLHNNMFFEFLSNHPFNLDFDRKKNKMTFFSSTFGGYLIILDPRVKGLKQISEEQVVNFYKTLQDNNLFESYTNFIYTVFTNAYDKSYPPISKKLSLSYIEKRQNNLEVVN